jgi:hypothetical protein
MLLEHPDLPIFVLSEIRSKPGAAGKPFAGPKALTESVFIKQLKAKRSDIHPFHFLMNYAGYDIVPVYREACSGTDHGQRR